MNDNSRHRGRVAAALSFSAAAGAKTQTLAGPARLADVVAVLSAGIGKS
jgi:hypothetical protein